MNNLVHKEEAYKVIGICMTVHKQLGKGFSEIVYKDALEYECKENGYSYEREKEYLVHYKEIVLPHKFYADFVLFDKIILEIKNADHIANEFIAQTLNYLAASQLKVGLIVNF